MNKSIQKDFKVSSAEFENDGTDELTVKVETPTTTFYIQTVEGEYRPSLGCLISTAENGEIDQDDYPEIDIVIKAAEQFAESLLDLDNKIENHNYYNKDASPYQRRFENKAKVYLGHGFLAENEVEK